MIGLKVWTKLSESLGGQLTIRTGGLVKTEEKHDLMAKAWLFQFLAMGVILSLAFVPWGRSSPEEKVLKARARAEVLAYQVAQLYRESLNDQQVVPASQRGPASIPAAEDATPAEGLMGQDPWGRAYSYRIVPVNGRLRVEMKSAGPDGSPDGEKGDDILLVLTL